MSSPYNRYPRYVYVIFPNGEDLKPNHMVYVGITTDVRVRISEHRNYIGDKDDPDDSHEILGRHMYLFGYQYRIVDIITNEKEERKEYDWIDFFDKLGYFTILNKVKKKDANCAYLLAEYFKQKPVFNYYPIPD